MLVAAVECEDYDAARQAFSESALPIDVAQREAMPRFTDGVLELAPVFDVRAFGPADEEPAESGRPGS